MGSFLGLAYVHTSLRNPIYTNVSSKPKGGGRQDKGWRAARPRGKRSAPSRRMGEDEPGRGRRCPGTGREPERDAPERERRRRAPGDAGVEHGGERSKTPTRGERNGPGRNAAANAPRTTRGGQSPLGKTGYQAGERRSGGGSPDPERNRRLEPTRVKKGRFRPRERRGAVPSHPAGESTNPTTRARRMTARDPLKRRGDGAMAMKNARTGAIGGTTMGKDRTRPRHARDRAAARR